jgi:hypothetical protein
MSENWLDASKIRAIISILNQKGLPLPPINRDVILDVLKKN